MAIDDTLRKVSFALFACAVTALHGCANIMTIERSSMLPNGGRAVHLDAPQRLAYASKLGVLCAEPSPDALQAYAASLGTAVSSPTKESASIAIALSGSATSFGLRTQSITLMRDHLYRICEAYYNGKINEGDVISLMQRSQDLTLGILAIEQLTGAVVARQGTLTPGSDGGASAGLRSAADALAAAKKDEDEKKEALAAATSARDKQKEAVSAATAELAAKKAAAAPAQATVDALKPQITAAQVALNKANEEVGTATGRQLKQKAALDATTKALEAAKAKQDATQIEKLAAQQKADQAQLDKEDAALTAAKKAQGEQKAKLGELQAQSKTASEDSTLVEYRNAANTLKSQQDALKKTEASLKSASDDFALAQKITKLRQDEQNAGVAMVTGRTTSTGTFSSDDYRNNVNKDTIGQIAEATRSIVETVVYKGRLTEACANMMTAYARNPASATGMDKMMPVCNKVFDAAIQGYLKGIVPAAPLKSEPAITKSDLETPAPARRTGSPSLRFLSPPTLMIER